MEDRLDELIIGIHMEIMEFFFEYIENPEYPEETWKGHIDSLQVKMDELIEISNLPEHKHFMAENAEFLAEALYYFDKLKGS